MHRSHSLAQSGSLLRAFFLFVLLIGVQSAALTSFVVAKEAVNTIGNPRLASNKPQAVKPQHTMRKSNPHARAIGLGPDLGITIAPSNSTYSVGSTVSYTLTVSNSSTADPIATNATPVTVTDVISAGLSNVAVTTSPVGAWSFTGANPTSPALIVATYTGPFPITAGEVLPTISITGTANDQAAGLLSNTGTVVVSGDLNLANNTATVSVNILPTATPIPTTIVLPTVALPTTTVTVPLPTTTVTVTLPTTTVTVTLPTTTVTVVPTTTAIASATPTAVVSPAITISNAVEGSTTAFQVGQAVTYDLIVTNSSTSGPTTGPITVSDVVPLGFSGLAATGTGWTTTLTDTVGPALLTATYAAIVAPGQTLPPLHLTGTLAGTAGANVSNSAQVFTVANSAPTFTSNVSVISVAPAVSTTPVVFPCTATSITLPCVATAATEPCSASIAGTGAPVVVSTVTVTANWCIPPDVSIVGTTLDNWNNNQNNNQDNQNNNQNNNQDNQNNQNNNNWNNNSNNGFPASSSSASPVPGSSGLTDPGSSTLSTPSSSTFTAPVSSTSTSSSKKYTVGDHVTYVWIVSNLSNGGPANQPITVGNILPIGATDIHASGSNWTTSVSDNTSPSVINATYTGMYPVPAGAVLPPLIVNITLTKDAVSSFCSTATVDETGDTNLANNTYAVTVFVQEKHDHNQDNNNNNNHDNNNGNNNNHDNNNGNNNNHNNNNGNNNSNNNHSNNSNNNSNNNHAPGLPGTGSDPSIRIASRAE